MRPLHTGPEGIALMHYFESCKLQAYPDPATGGKPWTIGWGDTGPDVMQGLVITQQQADARFARRLSIEFEPGVQNALQKEPRQYEFDAFVSLAYNIGLDNFRGSTALRRFNLGDKAGVAAGIQMWNKANGAAMLGLRRRRLAESLVFAGRPAAEAIEAAKRLM